MPYGAETINEMYGMEGRSKYKKIGDSPNREKIARRLTDGKVKWGQGRGEKKDYKQGRSDKRSKGMVLFPGFCFGSYQTCLHSKRTGSNHTLCHTEGV